MKTKFIFITGGVLSSLGKGLAAASVGALLQARGESVWKLGHIESHDGAPTVALTARQSSRNYLPL